MKKKKKLSEFLIDYGYDYKEVRKFFKDVKSIMLSQYTEGVNEVVIDDLFTVSLKTYDPRRNPYRLEKNYFVTKFPTVKPNRTFINDIRYATKHLLTDEEREYNKQVEEKIRIQKAYDGTSEEDEESIVLL